MNRPSYTKADFDKGFAARQPECEMHFVNFFMHVYRQPYSSYGRAFAIGMLNAKNALSDLRRTGARG